MLGRSEDVVEGLEVASEVVAGVVKLDVGVPQPVEVSVSLSLFVELAHISPGCGSVEGGAATEDVVNSSGSVDEGDDTVVAGDVVAGAAVVDGDADVVGVDVDVDGVVVVVVDGTVSCVVVVVVQPCGWVAVPVSPVANVPTIDVAPTVSQETNPPPGITTPGGVVEVNVVSLGPEPTPAQVGCSEWADATPAEAKVV